MTERQNNTAYDTNLFSQDVIQKYKKELLELYKRRAPHAGVARPPGPFPPIPPEPEIVAPTYAPLPSKVRIAAPPSAVAIPPAVQVPLPPVTAPPAAPAPSPPAAVPPTEAAPPPPATVPPEEAAPPPAPIPKPPSAYRADSIPPPEEPRPELCGSLQLEVIVGKTCAPLENAFITLLKEENGRRSVLRFTVTDACGETPVIPLEIPALHSAGGLPYITCTARITAEGYYPVEKPHIPVYAGVKTIQCAEMVPLAHFDECAQNPDFFTGVCL